MAAPRPFGQPIKRRVIQVPHCEPLTIPFCDGLRVRAALNQQPIRPATHTIVQPWTPALKCISRYIFGRTSALCQSVYRDAALHPHLWPCPGPLDQPRRVAPHSNTLHWYTLHHPQPCPSFEAKTRVRGLVGIAHECPSEQSPFSCFYDPSIRLLEECCFRPPRCNLGRRDPARISTCRTNSSGCLLGYTTLHSLAATFPPTPRDLPHLSYTFIDCASTVVACSFEAARGPLGCCDSSRGPFSPTSKRLHRNHGRQCRNTRRIHATHRGLARKASSAFDSANVFTGPRVTPQFNCLILHVH